MGHKTSKKIPYEKIDVLAVDALDPHVIEQGIENNVLPNFRKLKDEGYFSQLGTSTPPQSPVAWANFIVGGTTSKHGVYDFIGRDPKDYRVSLNMSDSVPHKWLTKPYWEVASENGLSTTTLFLPDTYPVPKKIVGKMISGMGTPDVLGTEGTFTLFTTKDYPSNPSFRGMLIRLKREVINETVIKGPKFRYFSEVKNMTIPLEVKVVNDNEVRLNFQNNVFTLKKNEFSDWKKFVFDVDIFTHINGVGKFYLKSVTPELELYLSPINFDPENPVYPISYPKDYAKDTAKKMGLFHTQGLPIDSWALEEGVLDDKAFLSQASEILNEREKIYLSELANMKKGVLIAYFGSVDTVQHMFWSDEEGGKYSPVVMDYYEKIDRIIGETIEKIDKKTTLVVLSDHGFGSFNFEINLNNWLNDNKYQSIADNKKASLGTLDHIDWSKTRAYSIGYNGIYLNLKGREGKGIVDKKDYDLLLKELSKKLLEFKNPYNNAPIIKKVYTKKDLGIPDSDVNSPDLVIGFYKGARSSWDNAVGQLSAAAISPRKGKWKGDHLFDPSEVPGVLLMNKKSEVQNPKISDVMPSILGKFNITMNGGDDKNIFNTFNQQKESEHDQKDNTNPDTLMSLPYR